jgi:hypothetical protein
MSEQNFDKLIEHPKAEEIISKLVTGIRPKDVADWLKLEFPNKDQVHLRLGSTYLKDFLDQNLNLYDTLKKDIASVKSGDADKKISPSLRNNKTYQERLTEMAGTEIDIKKLMVNTGILIQSRLEQFYDKIQQNPENIKPDHALIKYFELMLNFADRYNKIVNESPDQIIQHNVTVQVMDQYVAVMQETIRETLSEVDPDAAFLFMEKFNEKLPNIQLPEMAQPKKSISTQDRLLEAQILTGKFEAINGEET